MVTHEQKPHFVLLPFMAQGHTIPMIDIARLLANRGVIITVLTTPINFNRFKPVITRAIESGLNIHVRHLKFPCVEAGLPEGHENFDMLPDITYGFNFLKAIVMLRDQVEELLQELKPFPSCFIADMCFTWASDVALKVNVPRIVFHGMCCFSLLCLHLVETSKDLEDVASETEYFVVPGLPDRIEITKAQIRGIVNPSIPAMLKIREQMREAEGKAFGTVVNSFEELEPAYVKEYNNVKSKKVWCLGPVSLCNKDDAEKAERGKKASIGEPECLKWLEAREPSSVIYVCLGTVSSLATLQLIELGLALEATNRHFIWVIRNASEAFGKWLVEEKYEERIKDRGLLIHGWAPQVLILSHPSVGGFLTHCGWNSSLEGITAGVPMVTWPVSAEQFVNEKFIVSVIMTGIKVGVEVPVFSRQEENVLVKSDEIKMAIEKLMDSGEAGNERRERAKKLKDMAKIATEEGGSSWSNLTLLVQDVMELASSRGEDSNDVKIIDENSDDIITQRMISGAKLTTPKFNYMRISIYQVMDIMCFLIKVKFSNFLINGFT